MRDAVADAVATGSALAHSHHQPKGSRGGGARRGKEGAAAAGKRQTHAVAAPSPSAAAAAEPVATPATAIASAESGSVSESPVSAPASEDAAQGMHAAAATQLAAQHAAEPPAASSGRGQSGAAATGGSARTHSASSPTATATATAAADAAKDTAEGKATAAPALAAAHLGCGAFSMAASRFRQLSEHLRESARSASSPSSVLRSTRGQAGLVLCAALLLAAARTQPAQATLNSISKYLEVRRAASAAPTAPPPAPVPTTLRVLPKGTAGGCGGCALGSQTNLPSPVTRTPALNAIRPHAARAARCAGRSERGTVVCALRRRNRPPVVPPRECPQHTQAWLGRACL
jgi:hypothetical protein